MKSFETKCMSLRSKLEETNQNKEPEDLLFETFQHKFQDMSIHPLCRDLYTHAAEFEQEEMWELNFISSSSLFPSTTSSSSSTSTTTPSCSSLSLSSSRQSSSSKSMLSDIHRRCMESIELMNRSIPKSFFLALMVCKFYHKHLSLLSLSTPFEENMAQIHKQLDEEKKCSHIFNIRRQWNSVQKFPWSFKDKPKIYVDYSITDQYGPSFHLPDMVISGIGRMLFSSHPFYVQFSRYLLMWLCMKRQVYLTFVRTQDFRVLTVQWCQLTTIALDIKPSRLNQNYFQCGQYMLETIMDMMMYEFPDCPPHTKVPWSFWLGSQQQTIVVYSEIVVLLEKHSKLLKTKYPRFFGLIHQSIATHDSLEQFAKLPTSIRWMIQDCRLGKHEVSCTSQIVSDLKEEIKDEEKCVRIMSDEEKMIRKLKKLKFPLLTETTEADDSTRFVFQVPIIFIYFRNFPESDLDGHISVSQGNEYVHEYYSTHPKFQKCVLERDKLFSKEVCAEYDYLIKVNSDHDYETIMNSSHSSSSCSSSSLPFISSSSSCSSPSLSSSCSFRPSLSDPISNKKMEICSTSPNKKSQKRKHIN